MKDTLGPIDTPEIEPEEVNPWVDIWLSPRVTIEWIVKNGSVWMPWILLYIGGVHYGIENQTINGTNNPEVVATILQHAIFISGVGGIFIYVALIAAIHFCTTWFGGNGTFKKTLIAFAWSMIPAAVSLVLALLGYLIFGEELFMNDKSDISNNEILKYLFWAYSALQIILRVWFLGLLFIIIAQVQQFSIGRSIASVVCGLLLLFVPFITFIILAGGTFMINF